ncbi:MAG: hypothetical protein QXI16_00760 [Sulfolobaceae archaeon]
MKKVMLPILALVLIIVMGCSTAPKLSNLTPNEKIAMIDSTITAIGKTTLQLYNAHKITQTQVKYIYQGLSTAAALADTAQKSYASNATAGDMAISEAITLLQQLQTYLTQNSGGNQK